MSLLFNAKAVLFAGVAAVALVPFAPASATGDDHNEPQQHELPELPDLDYDTEHLPEIEITVNANVQINKDVDEIDSETNDNTIEIDLDDDNRALIADEADAELVDQTLESAATGNTADNAVFLGTGVVYEENSVSLNPADGPVLQVNKQINDDVEIDSETKYNTIEIATQTKTSDWPGQHGNDLKIKNTALTSAATGNNALNRFLGDVSNSDPYGSPFLNVSIQKNDDVDIEAETKYNDIVIDPDGKYSGFDISIANTSLSATAVGNDVINLTGLATGRHSSSTIAQINVQKNTDTVIDAQANYNRVAIDPSYRATYGTGDLSIRNTTISSTAIGNRAVNRLGGPDLGGIKK